MMRDTSPADAMRRWLPFLLSIVAGAVDTTSFLALSHLFAAHVTGNIVVLAATLVSGHPQDTIGSLLSVPWFVVVVGAVSLFGEALRRRQRSALRWLLTMEALLLAAALTMAMVLVPIINAETTDTVLLGLALVTAMAVQNALNPVALGNAPPTAAMTGNVTRLVADTARLLLRPSADRSIEKNWRAQAHQLLWPTVGFVGGCAVGAGTFSTIGFHGLAVPLALICLAAATAR
jgi:uncharacterized membrane protein YoaK (UPF0700 family)